MRLIMNESLLFIENLILTLDDEVYLPSMNLIIKEKNAYLIDGPNDSINIALLKTIGGLLPPSLEESRILFRGTDIYNTDDKELKEIRKNISFVFSEGTMISNLSVRENLFLPIQYHYPHYDFNTVLNIIKKDFDYFGIPDILDKRPAELSYNRKKLLAFIRASIQEPKAIMIDKPLFNLDDDYHSLVIHYLNIIKNKGTALVIVNRFHPGLDSIIDEHIILEKEFPSTIKEINSPPFIISDKDENNNIRRTP